MREREKKENRAFGSDFCVESTRFKGFNGCSNFQRGFPVGFTNKIKFPILFSVSYHVRVYLMQNLKKKKKKPVRDECSSVVSCHFIRFRKFPII